MFDRYLVHHIACSIVTEFVTEFVSPDITLAIAISRRQAEPYGHRHVSAISSTSAFGHLTSIVISIRQAEPYGHRQGAPVRSSSIAKFYP